jgi:opacity protein-like surface antigen
MALLACVLCVGPALAEMKGGVHVWLGQKWMDSDWEPVDQPTQYGIGANFGGVDWPVMIAVDVLMGSDDECYDYDYGYGYVYSYDLEVDGTELDVGVRKFWDSNGKFQPYVGGGLAYIKQDIKATATYPEVFGISRQITESISIDDSGTGFWLNAGVNWVITPRLYLGLDLRYSDADVEYSFEDIEVRQTEPSTLKINGGGTHAGLVFGVRF